MAFDGYNSMSQLDIKDEICLKDEPLEYCSEDAFISVSSEHSALQTLNLKPEDILPVSSCFLIILHLYLIIQITYLCTT